MSQAEWIQAFTTAQGQFPPIVKGSTVDTGSFSYNYAALPDIIETVVGHLHANGLVVAQSVTGDGASVSVETRIYHEAGWVEVFGPLALKVSGDAKAAGSAITYARRYALCAALGIAPDEDDDGTRASQAPAREELTPESEADAAWRWLWGESAIFKAWTDEERMAAIQSSLAYLKLPAVEDRTAAERIFAHLVDEYAKRPMEEQGALPVE